MGLCVHRGDTCASLSPLAAMLPQNALATPCATGGEMLWCAREAEQSSPCPCVYTCTLSVCTRALCNAWQCLCRPLWAACATFGGLLLIGPPDPLHIQRGQFCKLELGHIYSFLDTEQCHGHKKGKTCRAHAVLCKSGVMACMAIIATPDKVPRVAVDAMCAAWLHAKAACTTHSIGCALCSAHSSCGDYCMQTQGCWLQVPVCV